MATKGISRDTDPILQPEGTTPYVLNGNITDDYGALTNEHSTKIFSEISSGYTIVLGSIILDNKEKVLFTYTPSTSSSDIIRILNDGNIFHVAGGATSGLNFSSSHQVEATFKLNNLNEYIVYWTDNYNPPRRINVSNATVLTTTNVKLLNIFNEYIRPQITLTAVNDYGGSVESGVYQAFMAYVSEDGTETEWTSFSNMISVTPSVMKGSTSAYSGSAPGLTTTKSITLTLSNLDTTYKKMKVGVIQYNDSVIVSPKVFFYGGFNSTTEEVVFTNREIAETLSIEEVVTGKAFYNTAKTINQLEGVLYMGNLSESVDLGLQKYANGITSSYVTTQTNLGANSFIGSYKDPVVIFNKRGYLHDDAYCFYISFVLKNGKETKAYHIPGRTAVTAINPQTLTDLTGYSENDLLSTLTPAQKVVMGNYGSFAVPDAITNLSSNSRFFQIFNTANNPNASTNMGYWENQNENYPDTDDWDIFTVDISGNPVDTGNSLRNNKVRHHKFPHPEIKTTGGNYINTSTKNESTILGIRFSNIAIPAEVKDQIVGFKFYYGKRSGGNSLIVGQTIGLPQSSIQQISLAHNYNPTGNFQIDNGDPTDTVNSVLDWKYLRLHAPLFQRGETGEPEFNINTINYLKTIGQYNFYNVPAYNYSPGPEFEFGFMSDYRHASSSLSGTGSIDTRNYIKSLKEVVYVPLSTTRTWTNNASQLNMSKAAYSYQVEESAYVEMNSALYNPPGPKLLDLNNIAGTYLLSTYNHLPFFNCCQYLQDLYNGFDQQTLVDTGSYIDTTGMSGYIYGSTSSIFGGDIFSSYYFFRTTNELGDFFNYQFGAYNDPLRHITGYYFHCQSPINVNLRHIGSNIYSIYYPKWPLTTTSGATAPSTGNGVLELTPSSTNLFYYNNDYSKVNELIQPIIFDKLNNTEVYNFKTRIIRSAKDNLEGTEDNFKSFAVNDYVDLPKNRGQIEKLSQIGDNLIIHLSNSITKTLANEILKVNDTNAFLGSGDIFAIPAKEIVYTDIGYGGTTSQWSPVATPFGLIYPDVTKGKVYSLANGIDEISANGMTGWALDNIKLFIDDEFRRLFNVSFPLKDCPSNEAGVGFIAAWDDLYRRYILTKRDYTLTAYGLTVFKGIYNTSTSYTTNDLVFKTDTDAWYVYNGSVFVKVNFMSETWDTLFEDKSFTIGYYPEFKAWISFYDYKPYHYIYDNRDFYSINRNADFLTDATNLWQHNDPLSYCSFYGNPKSKFEVDIVYNNNPQISKIFSSFQYSTKFTGLDNNITLTKTFDNYQVYNSYQLTDIKPITNLVTARLVNTLWNVNQFRNLRDDYNIPVYDVDFNITGTVDTGKPFYEQERFSDKYLIARLSYDNTVEGRLSLQLSTIKEEPKVR